MRSFLAITIPREAKVAIENLQRELRSVDPAVTWSQPENVHLTLKFLGEIDEKIVPSINDACSDALKTIHPFTLVLSHPGVFPNFRNPRVLWVGLKGELEPLANLQAVVEGVMSKLGFRRENGIFRPHLTIGRVKSSRNIRQMLAISEMYLMPEISFEIRDLTLFKSELSPKGSKYTVITRLEFGAAG